MPILFLAALMISLLSLKYQKIPLGSFQIKTVLVVRSRGNKRVKIGAECELQSQCDWWQCVVPVPVCFAN